MPSNIEIKAKLLDKDLALDIAKQLSQGEGKNTKYPAIDIQSPHMKVQF